MAKQTVWGFAGNRDLDELKDSNDYILKKIMRARSKKDTRILRRILFGVIFAMVFSFGFLILVSNILAQAWYTAFFFVLSFYVLFYGFFACFGLIIAYAVMTSERSSYIVDNLNFLMAERFHFLYEAKHSRKQWKQFKEIAPEIFNRGNNGSQVIDNQFYGTFTLLNHTYESHFGSFVYQTGGKNKQTNFRHFIAFRLEKPLVSRFSVLSEDPFFEFIGGRKSAFELESNEFNKKFNIAYSTKENHDVYKIMTPLIQEFFLNLQETYGRVNVLFAQDFVLFDFEGNFYSGSGLDFKDFDVDTETFTFFEQKMQTTLYYAQQLLKKLH